MVGTRNTVHLDIVGSTITGNSAAATVTDNGDGGGGISEPSGKASLALDSTIVSGNYAVNGRADISVSNGVAVMSTYSAIGNITGFTYIPGVADLSIGSNLNLQLLANNGGPTQTIAFAVGSPLRSTGDPALAGTTDQRGVPRTLNPGPDIGSTNISPSRSPASKSTTAPQGALKCDQSPSPSPARSRSLTVMRRPHFELEHLQDSTDIANLAASVSINAADQTVVTLTFTTTGNSASEIDPVSAENGGMASLADGQFQLTVLGAAVTDAVLGWNLDGDADGVPGGDYVSPTDTLGGGAGQLHLYRLFGDTDGNGIVDQVDLAQFRSANNSSSADAAYIAALDADNSGAIDQFDLAQFRQRNNANVFGPMVPLALPPTVTPDLPDGSTSAVAPPIAGAPVTPRGIRACAVGAAPAFQMRQTAIAPPTDNRQVQMIENQSSLSTTYLAALNTDNSSAGDLAVLDRFPTILNFSID